MNHRTHPKNLEFDFEAEVHFVRTGRRATPVNGYRADFKYADESGPGSWMIWPLQFFTEAGNVPDGQQVPWDCFARFYILDRELRESVHRERIRTGVRFEIVEGWKVVANGTVTRLLSLSENGEH